jgi:hypothetical protein
MIAAVVFLGVALVVTIVVFVRSHAQAQADWAEERRELLNRIQFPDHRPTTAAPFETPEVEPDESHMVGMIYADPTE